MLKRIDIFPVADEVMHYESLNALQICSIFYDLDLIRTEVVKRSDLGLVFYIHYKNIETVPISLKKVLQKYEQT